MTQHAISEREVGTENKKGFRRLQLHSIQPSEIQQLVSLERVLINRLQFPENDFPRKYGTVDGLLINVACPRRIQSCFQGTK